MFHILVSKDVKLQVALLASVYLAHLFMVQSSFIKSMYHEARKYEKSMKHEHYNF